MKSAMLAIILTCVLAATVSATTTITPIAISNHSLGGVDLSPYTPGVAGAWGPNNIGLLVKTWGRVTYLNTAEQYFYIDDGSKMSDGSKRPDNSLILGVRVTYSGLAPGVTVDDPPGENAYVAVIGISSTVLVGGVAHANLRVRRESDILSFL